MKDGKSDLESNIEQTKLKIEEQKLKIELEKLRIEKSKLVSSSLIGGIPLLALVITIIYGVWTQRQQENLQFQVKLAEIIINSNDAYEARGRADILKVLFPERIPNNFANSFFPDSLGFNDMSEVASKKEIIKIMATYSKSSSDIVKLWKKAFPRDLWVDSLGVK